MPELRWRRWRYEVRDEEIDLRHGTVRITRTLVPMLRVQHVDTTQGPLDQALKLATVVVHTAAGATIIPALLRATPSACATASRRSPAPPMSSERHKLHPAAIGVLALNALREAALPIVILFATALAGSGGLDIAALRRGALYLVIGVGAATLMGFLRWRSTSYVVDERGVHWQTGVVRRKATTVPLSRIQGLDTVAGPVQRLFGVVALSVQTAGGGAKGEIVLDAVGPAAVERLREAVQARRPEALDAAPRPGSPNAG